MLELFPGTYSLLFQSNKKKQFTRSVTTNWLMNINMISIDYAFGPRLRDRLTLRWLALHRNPWIFGDNVSHVVYRYLCQHSHFWYLQQTLRFTFNGLQNAPLPLICYPYKPVISVHSFSPDTFWARKDFFRPVSCYAFFKGWLLLSQPPGCFGLFTSFHT